MTHVQLIGFDSAGQREFYPGTAVTDAVHFDCTNRLTTAWVVAE